MKSLFWRIFISFWVATTLIIVAAVGLTVAVAWSRFLTLASFNAPEFVESANRAARQGGDPALRIWLKSVVDEHGDLAIYLLDREDHDMLGRPVPQRLREERPSPRAAMQGTASPSPSETRNFQFMRPRNHVLVSTWLDHERWRLIAAWYGASPVDVLGSGHVWIGLALLALILSGAICWLIAGHITRPVVSLQASARRLAEGQLEERVAENLTRRGDELGLLAREFNSMSAQIQEQLASKEMLLRDISHEFRSPLTRLRVAAGLARVKADKVDDYLERIERDIERLDRLIDDTLRFSMVGTPGLTLPVETEDLVALVGEAFHDAEIEAQDKGVDLLWQQAAPTCLPINQDLMYRAVDNVLRNAIRHSPSGGVIRVAVSFDGGFARVVIEDEGPGVPDADLERIFEAFYRVSKARERQTGGAGLGLALTARVAALHGGVVAARNRKPHGLSVIISLPLT